ncbi:unnamed protein product, partial [Vitis vinifera]|uniref:40S ribosomal protein S12 n=2 Tax=Vitis vinifera TaxID=29760 RepID=D7U865_VITVI
MTQHDMIDLRAYGSCQTTYLVCMSPPTPTQFFNGSYWSSTLGKNDPLNIGPCQLTWPWDTSINTYGKGFCYPHQTRKEVDLNIHKKMSGEEVVVAVETSAPAPALGEPMDLMTALQLVLRKSLAHGGLARGLHEGAKVIEKHAAHLCVLAEDCNQPDYVKLVKALCADHNVSLITVPSAKTLGEWAGLCKIDSEGKARKVVGCSCVVVKDFGEETEAMNVVQQQVKSH